MLKRRLFLAVAAALIAAAACRRAEPPPRGPAPERPAILRFRPPADGRLTEAHLVLYVRVRRAARGRTDADAARAIGADPEEFAWIRARVVEALVHLDARRVREASAETYTRAIASLSQTRQSARDDATVRAIDEQIVALERERASARRSETPSPVLAENASRVGARRAELESGGP